MTWFSQSWNAHIVKADIRNPLRYLQDHKGSSRKRVLPYDIS